MSKCQTCGEPIDLSLAALTRLAFNHEDWRTCFCNETCRDAAVVTLMIAAEGNSTGEEYGIDAGTREAIAALVPLDEDAAPPEPADEDGEDWDEGHP